MRAQYESSLSSQAGAEDRSNARQLIRDGQADAFTDQAIGLYQGSGVIELLLAVALKLLPANRNAAKEIGDLNSRTFLQEQQRRASSHRDDPEGAASALHLPVWLPCRRTKAVVLGGRTSARFPWER